MLQHHGNMLACRQSIIAEMENSLAAQYAAMPQEDLHQQYVAVHCHLTLLGCFDVMTLCWYCRQSIIAEVENSLAAQYAAMPQEELHQWHATLQQGLSESSDAHHKAKDYLKQVSRSQLFTQIFSCHTCACSSRCLMSHKQLHTPDCKALNETIE